MVDRFADARPDFDRLGPAIERLVKAGHGLHEAYIIAKLARRMRTGRP
jgi:hypothetical protein